MGPPNQDLPGGAQSVQGQRVGPYILEKRLGSGGMAEVFLARKPLGAGGAFKHVVVKRMLRDLIDDDRFVDMFLREAGILAQLQHPNVVQIFDLGADDDELYIALEYLDGFSLLQLAIRSWRLHRPVPIELVVRVIAEVARGLDYVHRRQGPAGEPLNLVHRDVSPDNLFFVRDGTVKLLDFGVARGDSTKLITQKGELKGKVPYMSPEQLEGNDLDGRSDLFSLGVTAYWLLAGRRPFRGNTEVATMRAILRDTPERLSAVNRDVAPWLEDVVMKLLEKDRERRPRTGAEVDELITRHGGTLLNRAADAAFVGALQDQPDEDLDDVSTPMPAVPRAVVSDTLELRRPATAPTAPTAPAAPTDPFAGETARVARPPEIPPSLEQTMQTHVGPLLHELAEREQVGSSDLLPIDGEELESFDDGPTELSAALPHGMRGASVRNPSGSIPLPRAMAVEMPVQEEGGDTVRVTESQRAPLMKSNNDVPDDAIAHDDEPTKVR